jgi:uncharacterized protein DUF4209
MEGNMSGLDPSLIGTAIGAINRRLCRDYVPVFASRRDAATDETKTTWNILACLCDMEISWNDEAKEPFWPMFKIDQFDEIQLREASDLAIKVGDAELIARCCDVYWFRCPPRKRARTDIAYVRAAIAAYVQSARTLEDPAEWVSCERRVERALTLAKLTNMTKERDVILAFVEEMLARHEGRDPSLLSLHLMRILMSHGRGDHLACITYCDRAAQAQEAHAIALQSTEPIFRAQSYLEMQIRWMRLAKQDALVPDVEGRIARVWELAARLCIPNDYSVATHHQEQAVRAWRRANDASHAEAAHAKLLELQKLSAQRFVAIRRPEVDLTEVAHAAIDLVEGKDFLTAMYGLFHCVKPPSFDSYKRLLRRERDEGSVIAQLLPITQINAEGKPIAARNSLLDGDEGALYAEIVSRARYSQSYMSVGVILPCLRAFNADHPLRRADVLAMISESPLVDPERQFAIARAIHAGFVQDWVVVAHLIPPQVEHIVRRIFVANGVRVTGLDSQGIQKELDLNTLLWMEQAERIFGADFLLDLRALLIHPFGANLRNRMAHGLMNDAELSRTEIAYLWWLFSRAVIINTPWAKAEMAAADPAAADPAAADPAAADPAAADPAAADPAATDPAAADPAAADPG